MLLYMLGNNFSSVVKFLGVLLRICGEMLKCGALNLQIPDG